MSDIVRCGYTDTEWVASIARPQIRSRLLALATRRTTRRLNGQLSTATLAQMYRAAEVSLTPHCLSETLLARLD